MSTEADINVFHESGMLQPNERVFRALIENSSDVIVLLNAEGIPTYVSPSITRVTGYDPAEYLGSLPLLLLHPDDIPVAKQLFANIMQAPGRSFSAEYRMRCKDGSWGWFEGTATNLLHDPEVQAIVGSFRDISERKRSEEALQLSRHRLELAIQASEAGLWYCDLPFDKLIWNEKVKGHFGLPADAEVDINLFYELLHPDDRERTRQAIEQSIEKHSIYDIEYRTISPADGRVRWIHAIGRAFYDLDGTPRRFDGLTLDVTERKRAEQRKDEFLSMVSHELKTPVTSIKGFTQLLRRRFQQRDDEQSLQFLTRMDGQLTRLTKLINDLLDISRMQTGQIVYRQELFNLDAHMREVVENVQATTQTHQLLIEGETRAHVYADRDRIGQVLINLLTNAIKYSPDANRVIIRLEQRDHEAIVSVQDFGIGIAEPHHEKIFERFYQVADGDMRTFPGLGIGLYIATEIIKRHQGRIWVNSKPDEGATFSFALPVS
ncbi:MAG TPA: PAS domain S-box protein [Ktedonobacteraceae bacterium]|nr:PAS domain S-box protein [Ktedonobacteraceae bacterium]